MAVKPVTAPEISDTLVDLFGGGDINPTALMSSADTGDKILNPKTLAEPIIKPSNEAAKALQLAQQQEKMLAQQNLRQQEELRKAQQAEQKAREKEKKAVEKRLKSIRAEQDKLIKSNVENQGGKIGANSDGSFVSTSQVSKAIEMKEWNEIVSDKQRWSEADRYIKDFGDTLKQQGVADDVINNEQENARKLFKANIDAYVAKMNEDGTGAIDIVGRNLAKAGVGAVQALALLDQGAGYLAKKSGEGLSELNDKYTGGYATYSPLHWVGQALQGWGNWHQEASGGVLDWGNKANEWLDETASDSLRLKMANSAYDEAVWDKENKTANFRDEGISGVTRSANAAIGRMVENGLVVDNLANFAAQLVGAKGFGSVGAKAAVKAGTKVLAKEASGEAVGLSTRLLAGMVNTKYGLVNKAAQLGRGDRVAMGIYGTAMTAMDAGTGARSMVMNTSVDTIKRNLGADVWDETVKQYGSEEKAKKALADDATWTAVKGISPVAVVTSMFGVESAMAGLFTKKAIVQAAEETAKGITKKGIAKGAAKTALEGLSEGFEEGYTQYASNLGANPATGVDLQKGVGSAAGMGAFLGSFSAGAMNSLSAMRGSDGKGFEQKMQDMMSDFVENGNLDLNAFRTEFENQIATHRANLAKGGAVSPLEIKALTQRIYDMSVDGDYTITRSDGSVITASPLSLMTSGQQAEFKQFAEQYGVNTNDYRKAENSAWVNMFNNGDYNGVKQTEHEDLINAFRVRNNIDTDLIPPERLAYARAMARTIEYMNQQAQSVNTKQREEQFIRFRSDDLLNDETLTVDDLANLTAFSMDLLGANSARLSDQEQAQHNEQAGQNDPSQSQSGGQATSEQNVDGREQQASGQFNQEPTNREKTPSQELGGVTETPTRGNNSQSLGNDTTRQGGNPRSATDPTAQPSNGTSGNSRGVRQEQITGRAQATTETSNASEQTAGQGTTRQPDESRQPIRQLDPQTAGTPTSSGSTGATQAERSSNGGSPKTITEVKRDTVSSGARLSTNEAKTILSSRTKRSNNLIFKANEKKALSSSKVRDYFAKRGQSTDQTDVAIHLAGLTNNEMNSFIRDVFGDKKLKSTNVNHLRNVRRKLLEHHAATRFALGGNASLSTAPNAGVISLQQENKETQNDKTQHMVGRNETTTTRKDDDTRGNPVGDTRAPNDRQGEVPSDREQENGAEATRIKTSDQTKPTGENSQVDPSTYYTGNLTPDERANVATIATEFSTTPEIIYQAIVDGNIDFFTGNGKTRGADTRTMAKEVETQSIVDKGEGVDFINRLSTAPTPQVATSGISVITDYLNTNRVDKATLDGYLSTERSRLESQLDTTIDDVANGDETASERAAQLSQELNALPKTAEKLVEENIVDDKLIPMSERKRSLPDSVNAVIDRIYKAIKNTVAAVSMLAAVATGVNLAVPQDVMATSNFEVATVQHIVKTNDNQGKPIIIADKRAGTLTMYDANGKALNSTPALFGKNSGDSIKAKNTTPSGRYDLSYQTNINNESYGDSAQVLSQNGKLQKNNAGHLAIHRVLTAFPKENRIARLSSETGTDNRISHGCINVPTSWYDNNLNGQSEAVVYVLPETTAGRTGIFANVVENTTQQATVETSPRANVSPAMDNANTQSVEVSAQEIEQATQQAEVVKEQPIQAKAPITIKGTQPSEQVAYVAPVVVGGVAVIQANVPTNVHTPAEQRADGSFDTQAISSQVRTDEGDSVYDIATALTDILSEGLTVGGLVLVGAGVGRARRKRLGSKKKRENTAQNTVDENHNNVARKNKSRHVPDNLKAPPQKTKIQDAITREMWIEYLGTQFDNGQNNFVNEFADIMAGFDYSNLSILTDKSYQQSQDGSLDNGREWGVDITDKERAGVREKLFNTFAGATPIFDKLMTQLGMPRFGHEADSTIPTVMLAQIKAKSSGAYSQIHKRYLNPLIQRTDKLAMELRKGYREIKQDAGRVATIRHILTEAADATWKGYEKQIAILQQQIDEVNQELDTTPADKDYSQPLVNSLAEAKKAITEIQREYDQTKGMYEGSLVWDGTTPLPGGYTRESAEQQLGQLQDKYGEDFGRIDDLANAVVETIHSVRIFSSAGGVFSNADLQLFEELGYKRYVPLYRNNVDNPLTENDDAATATTTSIIDDLWREIPANQARSMGLTRDISRYRRKGATTQAADAFTNLEVFSINMSGRIGQQGWVDTIQQMYEGTVGKPISATQITNEETLAEINSQEESIYVPGLIRVLAGKDNYIERELKTKYKNIRPVIAKGYSAAGDLKTYHYYFTDPAIQNEIYASMDMNETTIIKGLRNVSTLTRYAARAMTTFKPIWNAYNWWRDSFERVSVMLMRPVKDQNGKLVNRWDMVKEYLKASSAMTFSLPAQNEIYRYLVAGEVKTDLQRTLHEAVGSGAINLMTAQTERHSVTADLRKSHVERLMKQVETALGTGLNKAGLGAFKKGTNNVADFYIARLTEVPQIITALASYQAYQNLGVNKRETQNRVRDQFDPLRANSAGVNTIGQLNPFVRSTLSGHYNLARSLTEYWKPGERKFTALYTLGSILAAYATLSLAGGIMGSGEDGEDLLSRIPLSTLLGGVPVKVGDSLWTAPVGFGWNKLMWGASSILYKLIHGEVTDSEAVGAVAGLVMDNTSPVTPASGSVIVDNPTAGMLLSVTPLLARPLVELATNTKSYGGQAIVKTKTPADQLNSDQDDFNTPDGYKAFAKWAYDTIGVDLRPEVVRHLVESYSFGPAGLVPKVLMQDRGDKYLGNTQSKGEHFGAVLTAIGADIGIQPEAFDLTKQSYKLTELRNRLHKELGVGATHKAEDYDNRSTPGKRGGKHKPKAVEVTEQKLREKGVDDDTINYIVNGMRYEAERKKLTKTFRDLSKKYQEARRAGTDTPMMRTTTEDAWSKLNDLTYNYVKENNSAYYKLLRK